MKAIILYIFISLVFPYAFAQPECNQNNYKEYYDENRHLRNCSLNGVNLDEVKWLRGVDLSKANLTGARLWSADLRYTNLSEANLRGADFSSANLQGSNLQKADITDAVLYGVNFQGARLYKAKLKGASLSKADLRDAKLVDADLRNVNLIDANLQKADLRQANLQSSVLSKADLSDANLQQANLSDSLLLATNFEDANLTYANLKNARLFSKDVGDAYFGGAKLSGADLRGASVSEQQADYFDKSGIVVKNGCEYISEPIYIKTKKCGGFCVGRITCDLDNLIFSGLVSCQSEGDKCPSPKQCIDSKIPDTASFIGTPSEYKSQFNDGTMYRSPGGASDQPSSGALQ